MHVLPVTYLFILPPIANQISELCGDFNQYSLGHKEHAKNEHFCPYLLGHNSTSTANYKYSIFVVDNEHANQVSQCSSVPMYTLAAYNVDLYRLGGAQDDFVCSLSNFFLSGVLYLKVNALIFMLKQVIGLGDTTDLSADTSVFNTNASRVLISKISGSGGAIALNVKEGKVQIFAIFAIFSVL